MRRYQPPAEISLRHTVASSLAAGGLAVAHAIGLAGSAEAHSTTSLTREHLSQNIGLVGERIRRQAEQAVRIPALRCSAVAFGSKQQPNYLTAQHCLPREQILGSDGNWYAVAAQPIVAQAGRQAGSMKIHGTITSFLMPGVEDTATDMTIGLTGATTQSALATLDKVLLPPAQHTKLVSTLNNLWLAGYPKENAGGSQRKRQLFNMTALERGTINTPTNTNVKVLSANTEPTGSGAIPSREASGSGVFYEQPNGAIKLVGVLSSLTVGGKPWESTARSGPVGQRNIVAGVAYDASSLRAPDARLLHVVPHESMIP